MRRLILPGKCLRARGHGDSRVCPSRVSFAGRSRCVYVVAGPTEGRVHRHSKLSIWGLPPLPFGNNYRAFASRFIRRTRRKRTGRIILCRSGSENQITRHVTCKTVNSDFISGRARLANARRPFVPFGAVGGATSRVGIN